MAVEPFLGTRAQKSFVATSILNAIIVLTMVAIPFGFVEANVDTSSRSSYKTIPCYLALFGLAEIFELLMALDALKLRNIIQLVGILAFHVALIVFSALQVHEARDALVFSTEIPCITFVGCDGPHTLWRRVEPFLIVVPCILSLSWLVMLFHVRELFSEFGWAVFQVVGANPVMKTMYQWYQILICLLKFDFFCFTGVTMQMLIIVLPSDSAEFGLTIAAIPIVLVLLVICGIAVKREIKWIMTISLILMLAAETYFIYKLVRFFSPVSEAEYETTRATLTVFTIVAFLLLFATFAVGLRCFSDFDKGLADAKMHDVPEKVTYSTPNTPGVGERQSSYYGGVPLQPRLSIE
ncbi:uncharacterized protein FOMMEDRAFT_145248 [Fomitiporia mediterranea MF3/22]|uniref:uncharacterized protein n=1 Tax=Fomitiporia mediterranea (strain MF3/22) TaxID=694068 RepID=UPI0004407ADD|nr:uncharacterized protein FOMMEDRAFT_145248 [Fomitiporia mediterranea MF3/22]EJD05887.1 hypothetical protein FOMMEDRAFT_145248 [Fomitiporia mediterranea MF3/22]